MQSLSSSSLGRTKVEEYSALTILRSSATVIISSCGFIPQIYTVIFILRSKYKLQEVSRSKNMG